MYKKMKFGICTGFDKKDGKVTVPHMDFIKSCGFDYVELALNQIACLSDGEFDFMKDFLRQYAMPCLACNCFMDAAIPMTGADVNDERFKSYVVKAVTRAGELGCEKLVLGSAGSRNVPSGFNMDEAEKQLGACIDFIIAELEKRGITLIIEHLNKGESNIVTTFEKSAEMSLARNNKAFKSILDTYHFCLGGESTSLIAKYNNQIGHVHFARTLGRTYPNPKDFPSLEPILTAIRESGYDDTFSMECSFPKMDEEPMEYGEVLKQFQDFFALNNEEKTITESIMEAREKGCNCCQSVVCGSSRLTGLDDDTAFKLSEGFGGGIGGTGSVCGAVTGMAMVAGSVLSDGTKETKMKTYKVVKAMIDEFGDQVGDIQCSTIKGQETGEVLMACNDCIKTAAGIIEKYLM